MPSKETNPTDVLLGVIYAYLLAENIAEFPFDKHHILTALPILKSGHFLGDLAGGIYHYTMDTFDSRLLKQAHINFRKHHKNVLSLENFPMSESLTELTIMGSPLLLCNLMLSKYTKNKWISDIIAILIVFNLVVCSAQIAHRMSHRRVHEYDKNGKKQFHIPKFVKWLQDHNIILNPEHHKRHHKTEVLNYCISNGSSSWLLDWAIDKLNLPVSIYNNSGGKHRVLDKKERKIYQQL